MAQSTPTDPDSTPTPIADLAAELARRADLALRASYTGTPREQARARGEAGAYAAAAGLVAELLK